MSLLDGSDLAVFAPTMTQASTGESMVLLAVVVRLLRRYPRLSRLLEYEGEAPIGGRQYDPGCHDPGEAGALGCTLWEVNHGGLHFHPHVSQVRMNLDRFLCSWGLIDEDDTHTIT